MPSPDLHHRPGFLSLRAAAPAQHAFRVYAEARLGTVRAWVPITYAAFLDYRLGAVTLSAGMLDVVRRMLAGEASIDGGELVFSKGAKVALHDQRPPRDRDVSLREYILSGAPELVAIEIGWDRLGQAVAGGAHAEATPQPNSAARARPRAAPTSFAISCSACMLNSPAVSSVLALIPCAAQSTAVLLSCRHLPPAEAMYMHTSVNLSPMI